VTWRTATGENGSEVSERPAPQEIVPSTNGAPAIAAEPSAPVGRQRQPDRRRNSPVGTAVKKFWIVLVIVAVIAVAGFCVSRLRTFFGDHDNRPITSASANDIKPFNPKHVVYEVYGPPGTMANINYLDINAQPQRIDNVPLPWTLSVITTLPSVSVNVVAQATTHQIGCRIIVNDVVKDERSAEGVKAQTFCIVKSA
jgi:hypothetical protein